MKKATICVMTALVLMALSACSNNQSAAAEITVSFNGLSGQPVSPTAVAYQVGDGEWVNLWPDDQGRYSFTVPAGETRYGVAVRCSGFVGAAFQNGVIYQLTTEESTSPRLSCFDFGVFAQMSGTADVSAVAGSVSMKVVGNYSSHPRGGTSNNYLIIVPESTRASAALLAYKSSFSYNFLNLVGGRVFHDINARGSFSRDLSLQVGDAISVKQLGAISLPAGFSSASYGVGLFAAGGAVIPVGDLSDGNQLGGSFATLAGTQSDDYYVISADTHSGDSGLGWLLVVSASEVDDVTASFNMIPFPSGYSVIPDPRPTFAFDGSNENLDLHYLITFCGGGIWQYMISSGWQGGATSYRLPDLESLIGFSGSTPRSGESFGWLLASARGEADPGVYFEASHFLLEEDIMVPLVPGLLESASVEGKFVVP